MGVDQGTTGTTVLLLDEDWNLAASSHKEHKQYYPQPGWVEHDPKEILAQIKEAAEEVMEKAHVTAEQVECMGIDNQGETVVVWDKVTGEPLIRQSSGRSKDCNMDLKELEEDIRYMIRQKTGLHADAYFGATKIKWTLTMWKARRKLRWKEDCWQDRPIPGLSGISLTEKSLLPIIRRHQGPHFSISIRMNGITNCWSFWKFRRAFFRRFETAQKNMDMPHCGGVTEKKERS